MSHGSAPGRSMLRDSLIASFLMLIAVCTAHAASKTNAGGGGVTDHGALTGLTDDDHPQYLIDPGTVTDDAVVRWDGTGGRTVQDTPLVCTDAGTTTWKDAIGGNTFLTFQELGTSGVLQTSGAANDGTTAFRQNTSTLKTSGNLIEIANGGIIGFAGTWDGVLTGGNSSSNHFVISSNTPSSAGITPANTGRIKLRERVILDSDMTVSSSIDDAFFTYDGTITSSASSTKFAGLDWKPTIKPSVAQVLSNAQSMIARPIIQHTAGVTDVFTSYIGVRASPEIRPDFSSGTLSTGNIIGFESNPQTKFVTGVAAIPNIVGYGSYTLGADGGGNHLVGSHSVTNLIHMWMINPTKDAGFTIPTQYGLRIGNLTSGTTFNIGVGSEINSGSTAYFLRSSGTADSVHTGDFRIGDTTQATQKLEVLGNILVDNGGTAGEMRLREPSASGSNYTAFKAQAQSANLTYTLPAADGSSGQVLSTNGSGTLSWATDAGSAPGGDADLTCDNATFTSAGETTLLTLPDFDNTGKTTNLAFSVSQTCISGARTQTFRLKAEGSTVATFQASCTASDPQTVSLVWQDTTSATDRTWILTAQSSGTGTQTVQQCSATRITF